MKTITKIAMTAAIIMMPVAALAADTTAKADAGKPAAESNLHGFDKYWSKMDPSGTGYVTKEHWMAHAAEQFKDIDTNGDGKISKDEMKAHDQKMREHFMEMHHQHMMMHGGMGGMNGGMMGGKGGDSGK